MSGLRIVNGWTLFAHPTFIDPVTRLIEQVRALQAKDLTHYREKKAAKHLAAIRKLILVTIPQDPTRSDYRQGDTLGPEYTHWFRAKFFQQYRLFFRYHVQSRIIVYAWVNGEATKRAYGSPTDAYRVFAKMLGRGHPPNDWDALLKEARAASDRFTRTVASVPASPEQD